MWCRGLCKKECKYWTNNDHCSQMDWAQLSWAVSWTKCVDPMLELLLEFDEISEKGRNIYEWNEINPILLEIDLLRTRLKEESKRTFRRFGISNTINIQYWLLLSNVTLRGQLKLYPPELIMVSRLGRSRFNHSILFHYYFASLVNMIYHLFHQMHPHLKE